MMRHVLVSQIVLCLSIESVSPTGTWYRVPVLDSRYGAPVLVRRKYECDVQPLSAHLLAASVKGQSA